MTLREMLGLVAGPVKLAVHMAGGPAELLFTASESGPQRMLSSLESHEPSLLDATVSTVDAENSKPVICGGSYFNDGPASVVIHVMRRTVL